MTILLTVLGGAALILLALCAINGAFVEISAIRARRNPEFRARLVGRFRAYVHDYDMEQEEPTVLVVVRSAPGYEEEEYHA